MQCSCGDAMEAGFIPDFGVFATWVGIWMPGEPDQHKNLKQKITTGGGVVTDLAQARQIEAYRCQSCGRLELYARKHPEVGASPG